MLEKKEIGTLALVTLVLALTISFLKTDILLGVLLAVFLVLVLNVAAKKVAAFYLDSEIEIRPWQMERYGWKTKQYFKKPFPIGVFLPIIVSLFSLGNLFWMASMVFDVKPTVYRAAKRHGLYSFSEMTEDHIGMIAAAGVFINLIAAVFAYFLGFPTFARLSVYYAFFSMLPLSDLDGNKIFFGNMVLWSFLATLVLIGLGYAFFLT
ncbi:MAG: hypothetical protein Q8P79_00335 [Nanoarchaeota archaeon]|nr:hypothetical protein [Nanoarchaeota archaeon]